MPRCVGSKVKRGALYIYTRYQNLEAQLFDYAEQTFAHWTTVWFEIDVLNIRSFAGLWVPHYMYTQVKPVQQSWGEKKKNAQEHNFRKTVLSAI